MRSKGTDRLKLGQAARGSHCMLNLLVRSLTHRVTNAKALDGPGEARGALLRSERRAEGVDGLTPACCATLKSHDLGCGGLSGFELWCALVPNPFDHGLSEVLVGLSRPTKHLLEAAQEGKLLGRCVPSPGLLPERLKLLGREAPWPSFVLVGRI